MARDDLVNKVTCEQRFDGDEGVGQEGRGGRVFQAEGTANAEAPCGHTCLRRAASCGSAVRG